MSAGTSGISVRSRVGRWLAQKMRILTFDEALRVMGASAPSKSGIVVTPESAIKYGAVFACVRVIAEDVAKLPLVLYRRTKNGGKERATDHPLYRILHDAPNAWQTSLEFREMLQGHTVLRGNGYAFINRLSSGEVRELLPLHPDQVTPKQDSAWEVSYDVRFDSGRPEPVPRDRVFHLRGLSTDGLVGLSVVGMAREAIGLGLATEKHGATIFGNGAHPGGILSHPKTLSAEAQARLKASWEERMSGDNANRPAILEEGMSWTTVGMKNDDAQFLETRKFQVTEIARWFRVPPHKIGDLDRATFSNIEHQALEYVSDTLLSWLRRWEQAITRDLLSPDERDVYFAEFLVDGLLRGDIASRYAAYAIGRTNGWLSANEIRAKENLNPITGGDEYLTPLNMTPAGGAPAGREEAA